MQTRRQIQILGLVASIALVLTAAVVPAGSGAFSREVAEPTAGAANWIQMGKASHAGRGSVSPNVAALAASANGDLYVGGAFTEISGVPLNNVGKWNGAEWSALGVGVDGPVRAIAVSGSDVYVGGEFRSAGGIAVHAIAKWDGKSWSSLGGGVEGFVYAIAVFKGEVYVGGRFRTAGGAPIEELAKWNGSSWSRPGAALIQQTGNQAGGVYALLVDGANLYVGGLVTIIPSFGERSAGSVARWDGERWFPLGDPSISGPVFSMAVMRGDLYVGGAPKAGGTIARWDGTAWSTLPSDVGATSPFVMAMVMAGDGLIIGSQFPAKERLDNPVKWDGNAWSTLGPGPEGVDALAVAGSSLYAGGSGGFIARWDGGSSPIAPPPPAKPVIPAPTITVLVDPRGINPGQSAKLVWESREAVSVNIFPEIGSVELTGMRQVSPNASTAYTVTATGPGGMTTESVSLSVTPTPTSRPPANVNDLISGIPPIRFDKDQDTIRPEETGKLDSLHNLLKDNATIRILVEGHADDGCFQECSIVLGIRRATAVAEALKARGIPESRISIMSYGKERPACPQDMEYCRPQNRIVRFRVIR